MKTSAGETRKESNKTSWGWLQNREVDAVHDAKNGRHVAGQAKRSPKEEADETKKRTENQGEPHPRSSDRGNNQRMKKITYMYS